MPSTKEEPSKADIREEIALILKAVDGALSDASSNIVTAEERAGEAIASAEDDLDDDDAEDKLNGIIEAIQNVGRVLEEVRSNLDRALKEFSTEGHHEQDRSPASGTARALAQHQRTACCRPRPVPVLRGRRGIIPKHATGARRADQDMIDALTDLRESRARSRGTGSSTRRARSTTSPASPRSPTASTRT